MKTEHFYLDSHVHLDLIVRHHPERLDWLKNFSIAPISWAFCRNPADTADLLQCLENHAQVIHD